LYPVGANQPPLTTNAPALMIGTGGPVTSAFVIGVTDPALANTFLGSHVTGVLEDPSPNPPGGPSQYWQTGFGTVLGPLQNNRGDATGVVTAVVTAQSIVNYLALSPFPTGYPSGRMLITITLSDGPHAIDLSIAGCSQYFCPHS